MAGGSAVRRGGCRWLCVVDTDGGSGEEKRRRVVTKRGIEAGNGRFCLCYAPGISMTTTFRRTPEQIHAARTSQYRPRRGPFSFSSRDLPRLTAQTKPANCQRLAASAVRFYEKVFRNGKRREAVRRSRAERSVRKK